MGRFSPWRCGLWGSFNPKLGIVMSQAAHMSSHSWRPNASQRGPKASQPVSTKIHGRPTGVHISLTQTHINIDIHTNTHTHTYIERLTINRRSGRYVIECCLHFTHNVGPSRLSGSLEYAITLAISHNIDDPYRNIHPPPRHPMWWGHGAWGGWGMGIVRARHE